MTEKDTSVIPPGPYCYTIEKVEDTAEKTVIHTKKCPYWSQNPNKRSQDNGHCSFLEIGDWESPTGGLLWDAVKECGINDDDLDDLEQE